MALRSWFRRLRGKQSRSTTRPPARPRLEVLEDRLAPANNISIVTGGSLTIPAGATTFTNHQNFNIDPSAFTGAGDVTLQANRDLNVMNALPILASGQDLTFQAGRHLSIGANIQGANALFLFTANHPGADQAERSGGDSALTVQAGVSVSNMGGMIDFTGGVGDSGGAGLHTNSAIVLNSGASLSASGGITLTGTGHLTHPNGVNINGATVNGNGGDVCLNGVSAFKGAGPNGGVLVQAGGVVRTTGTGTVTLHGTGRVGVYITGAGTTVSTVDGLLSITGDSPSSIGLFADGIRIVNGATVQATGAGEVILDGTASPNGISDLGVSLFQGGTVSVHDGDLSITGTGRGLAGSNIGVNVEGSTVRSTGTGSITIVGGAPANTAAISFADTFGGGTGTLSTFTGQVTLQGDRINLGAFGSVSSTGGATFNFLPLSFVPIILGGNNVAGSLVFTDADLAALSGFTTIAIGNLAGLAAPISTANNLTFASNLIIGNAANITSRITIIHTLNVGARNLTVSTGGPVVINSGGQLLSGVGGTISVTGTGATGAQHGIAINAGAINGNGGNVNLMGAGISPAVGVGVFIHNGATVQTSGAGTVTVNGTGQVGVQIGGGGAALTTVNGLLSITGTSPSSAAMSAQGILLQSAAVVQATGAGGVTLNGTGSPNSVGALGVSLQGGTVSVNNGPLNITGVGQGSAVTNIGVNVEGSIVRATGTGAITIVGSAPANTAAISFAGTGTLMAGSGNVTLTGDGINLGAAGSVSGTGPFLFQPLTLSRPLQLGGSNTTGRLVFTDTDRAALADGFSQITLGSAAGTGPVTTASNLTFATNLLVQSGGTGSAGITITHTLDVGDDNLTLTTAGPVAVNSPGQLRTSGSGTVTINAGVSLIVQSGALVQSGGGIRLNGDFLNTGGTTITVAAAALLAPLATLTGNSSSDVFNITPGGTTPLTVQGGGHGTTPTVTASATAGGTTISRTLPVGDLVNILDPASGAGTYTLNNTQFQRSGSNLVTLASIESLTVNLSTSSDTVNLLNSPAANTTLVGGGGADTFNLTNTSADGIVTINAAANSSTATNVSTTGAGSVVAFLGSPGFDNLVMLGSGASSGINFNAGNGGTGFGVGATGPGSVTQVVGGTGTDQGGIGNNNTASGVLGKVSVDLVSGPALADQFYFFDQADPGSFKYTLTASTISRTGVGSISYVNCAVLGLNTALGAATVQTDATAAGTATTIVGGPAGDSFEFSAAMGGTVVLDARGGNNTLVVSANDLLSADTITFSDSGVSDTQGVLQLTYFASAGGTFGGGMTLRGTPFNDMIFVMSARTDGPTTVNGQAGDDSFGMVVTTQSNYTATPAAAVTMNGGTGTNSLSLTSTSAGATIRNTMSSATAGVLLVTYPAPGLPSSISYQDFDTVATNPPAA